MRVLLGLGARETGAARRGSPPPRACGATSSRGNAIVGARSLSYSVNVAELTSCRTRERANPLKSASTSAWLISRARSGAEVEEDDGVAVLDAHARVRLEDRGRDDELVGDFLRVLLLDVGDGVVRDAATGTGDDVVGALDPIPPLVPVHPVVPAADRCDRSHAATLQVVDESPHETRGARRWFVATVEKRVKPHRCQAAPPRQLGERDRVILVAVDSSRGDQAEAVERTATIASAVHQRAQRGVGRRTFRRRSPS